MNNKELFKDAQVLMNQGRYKDARWKLDVIIESYGDSPYPVNPLSEYHLTRGLCNFHIGNIAAARDDFSYAQAINSDDPRVFIYMGLIKLLKGEDGDGESAFDNFETARRKAPRKTKAFFRDVLGIEMPKQIK